MKSYRIILADDHALFRQGMKRLIQEVPDLEIVGEASDGGFVLHGRLEGAEERGCSRLVDEMLA